MRSLPCLLLVAALAHGVTAAAAPLDIPTVDSYVWGNGETKDFSLSWDGALATFDVQDVGTAQYASLSDCCTDTFDRVRIVYPGATLLFTDLSINTMPVNTVFVDNLDLDLLSHGALDNLYLLTGQVTMQWDEPLARMPMLRFTATPESSLNGDTDTAPVPEPATLLLVGSGFASGSIWARRRRTRSRAAERTWRA
ncbi:MAG: PEP-CTERM sorting domain-containing protein [Vicinamibacterales bacterium]